MIALWTTLAFAAPPCSDVHGLLMEARNAFDDAEVEQARAAITRANTALSCQEVVVSRKTLLELYHLDALVSVAQEDSKGGLYAVIRAVTVDPEVLPPSDVGTELLERHRQWADRLSADIAVVSRTSELSDVWVDGVPLEAPTEAIAGEHYVQVRTGTTWWSGVVELAASKPTRGLPLDVALPVVEEVPPPPPRVVRRGGRLRPGVAIVGLGLVAGGAGLVGMAYAREKRFDDDPYLDDRFGDCTRDQSCWRRAREDRITADARRINALFLTGYGVSGLGVGMMGVELLVAPRKTGGASIGIRGRW